MKFLYSLPRQYRNNPADNVAFLFNDTVISQLRQIVDGVGRPLWNWNALASGEPETLLNVPVYCSPSLGNPTAG